MRIICVIGGTRAGKTYLCKELQTIGMPVCFPGVILRYLPASVYLNSSRPACPNETEPMALAIVDQAIRIAENAEAQAIILDGFPKNAEQYKWLISRGYRMNPEFEFLWVSTPYRIRRERAMRMKDSEYKLLAIRRLKEEIPDLRDLLRAVRKDGYNITRINGYGRRELIWLLRTMSR